MADRLEELYRCKQCDSYCIPVERLHGHCIECFMEDCQAKAERLDEVVKWAEGHVNSNVPTTDYSRGWVRACKLMLEIAKGESDDRTSPNRKPISEAKG